MKERIAIMDSFSSPLGLQENAAPSRLKRLNIKITLTTIVEIGVLMLLLLGILGPFVGTGDYLWQYSAYAVVMTSFVLLIFRDICERLLLKHKEKIKERPPLNTQLRHDEELKHILDGIWPLKGLKKILIASLYIPISIMALWHAFSGIDEAPSTPYWEYVKLPTLLLIVIMLVYFINDYRRLRSHIHLVETELGVE